MSILAWNAFNFCCKARSKRQNDLRSIVSPVRAAEVTLTQNRKIMKTKALLTAIATIALLMPSTAMASNHKIRHEVKRKHRIERKMHVAHRPAIGTRFSHRPVNGKFIIVNRERLWTANGVLYRMIATRTGTTFVVVGYLR